MRQARWASSDSNSIDGHPLAVFGEEALVRDIAWHAGGKLDHAVDQRHVVLAYAGHQAGAENGDDHGRRSSVLNETSLSRAAVGVKHSFSIEAIPMVDQSAAASIASMSSSDSPK